MATVVVHGPDELDAAAIVRIARGEDGPVVADALAERLDSGRALMLAALEAGGPVYGVTTGLGALSERPLDAAVQATHQDRLMLARAVGGPPWLTPPEVRAVLAVRLRTFVGGDASVGGALCRRLAAMIAEGILPAVPRSAMGTAGEVVALAHLAAPVTGGGAVLDADGTARPGRRDRPFELGPKEGVALIEGVPVTTALAVLRSAEARVLLQAATRTLASEFALTGAARDVLHPTLARGDDVLLSVTGEILRLAGTVRTPRALQPPVSFRVSAQILAHAHRAVAALDAAVERALTGVTDSPLFLPLEGRFVGTAGFAGYELAACLQALTVALAGVAEVATARLHRLMDPRVTGLTAQLSPAPGAHTGLAPVHKRAVGVVHALRRTALPVTIGTVETSGGQEDVQSFSLEAAESLRETIAGLADVVACEQLVIAQMAGLGARPPSDADDTLIADLAGHAADDVTDRAWGLDLETLRHRLFSSWE